MAILRKLLPLALALALVLGMGVLPASAEDAVGIEDKEQYRDMPGFIDLDLDASDKVDDANFVVMKEGSVILYAGSGMVLEEAENTFILKNPTDEARAISTGTPVAFIDQANAQATFFLPVGVTAQQDRIVFAVNPEDTVPEDLFTALGVSYDKEKEFSKHILRKYSFLEFECDVVGKIDFKGWTNLINYSAECYVDYAFENVTIKCSEAVATDIPLGKIPIIGISGLGLEVGLGATIQTSGEAEIKFDVEGGRVGFKSNGGWFKGIHFENLSIAPTTTVDHIVAEGDFQFDLNFGPSIDMLSVVNIGTDVAAGIDIKAQLKGDEGGKTGTSYENSWHMCKELSCLQGEIFEEVKLEAYVHAFRKRWSAQYMLSNKKLCDFHYSYTFGEFECSPCKHYLYLVKVNVTKEGTNPKLPLEGATVTYTQVPPYADRKGTDYIQGTTGADGNVYLYMPAGKVKITATSWQDEPYGSKKISKTEDYEVNADEQDREFDISLPFYIYMELVSFDANANGQTVENMPKSFPVQRYHTGTIPNEVPRREGYQFAGWKADTEEAYLPGDSITVQAENIILYAQWTTQPGVDFRIITYDPNGDDVVLPDNPQIYKKNVDGILLMNPWRKDYIFTGWTCDEIDLVDPELYVTVQWNGNEGTKSDYINRTYVANWKHVTYNVIWRNWDGSWLDVSRNLYNELPTYEGPMPPVRPSDDSYFYVFAGWTPSEITKVTEDTEYTAVYTAYSLLKLVSSPTDQTLPEGEEAVFQVVAAGGEGALTYQWYVIPAGSLSDGAQAPGGELIPGATSDTLTVISSEEVSGNRYYCLVQDEIGQAVASAPALLTLPSPVPLTGDGFPLGTALALLALSGVALPVIALRWKKRRSL